MHVVAFLFVHLDNTVTSLWLLGKYPSNLASCSNFVLRQYRKVAVAAVNMHVVAFLFLHLQYVQKRTHCTLAVRKHRNIAVAFRHKSTLKLFPLRSRSIP